MPHEQRKALVLRREIALAYLELREHELGINLPNPDPVRETMQHRIVQLQNELAPLEKADFKPVPMSEPTREQLAALLAALHYRHYNTPDEEAVLRGKVHEALMNFDVARSVFVDWPLMSLHSMFASGRSVVFADKVAEQLRVAALAQELGAVVASTYLTGVEQAYKEWAANLAKKVPAMVFVMHPHSIAHGMGAELRVHRTIWLGEQPKQGDIYWWPLYSQAMHYAKPWTDDDGGVVLPGKLVLPVGSK